MSMWNKIERLLSFTAGVCLACLAYAVCLCSCDTGLEELEDCEGNVLLYYRYAGENDSKGSVLPLYVQTITQNIYDTDGNLVHTDTISAKSCDGDYQFEVELPPGKYIVISWGNCSDEKNEDIDIPTSRAGSNENMENAGLAIDNTFVDRGDGTTYQGNGDRLHYARHTFTIEENKRTKIRVDMNEAYAELTVTIRGANVGRINDDYYMSLEDVPAQYYFIPAHVSRSVNVVDRYDKEDDRYPYVDSNPVIYLPKTRKPELVDHRTPVRINNRREVVSNFISYRYQNDTHQILSLRSQKDNAYVMRGIDLNKYFMEHGYNLDFMLRQHFDILIEIEKNHIAVTARILDWDVGW